MNAVLPIIGSQWECQRHLSNTPTGIRGFHIALMVSRTALSLLLRLNLTIDGKTFNVTFCFARSVSSKESLRKRFTKLSAAQDLQPCNYLICDVLTQTKSVLTLIRVFILILNCMSPELCQYNFLQILIVSFD